MSNVAGFELPSIALLLGALLFIGVLSVAFLVSVLCTYSEDEEDDY